MWEANRETVRGRPTARVVATRAECAARLPGKMKNSKKAKKMLDIRRRLVIT